MIHVILNSASGHNTAPDAALQVVTAFREAGLEVRLSEPSPVEIPAVVLAALADGAELVVAGGGDGTISSVASVLVDGSIPLGVLPLGSLNHFAKDLHIPLDLLGAVQTIVSGNVKSVDICRVGDRIFLNNSSIGVYPSIVEQRERLRKAGYRKWQAAAMATLQVLRGGNEVLVRLEIDGRPIISRTPFVFIGNNEYQVDGMHLGERIALDQGRLFVYLAPPFRMRHLPALFILALMGRARQGHRLEVRAAVELWIETMDVSQIPIACDGELLTLPTPLHFRISPRALRVMVPAA